MPADKVIAARQAVEKRRQLLGVGEAGEDESAAARIESPAVVLSALLATSTPLLSIMERGPGIATGPTRHRPKAKPKPIKREPSFEPDLQPMVCKTMAWSWVHAEAIRALANEQRSMAMVAVHAKPPHSRSLQGKPYVLEGKSTVACATDVG